MNQNNNNNNRNKQNNSCVSGSTEEMYSQHIHNTTTKKHFKLDPNSQTSKSYIYSLIPCAESALNMFD